MVITIIPKKVYLVLERNWPALEFKYKGDWVGFILWPWCWLKGEIFYSVGFMMKPFKRLKDIDKMWDDYFKALRDSNVKNTQRAKNEIQ